MTGSDNTVEKEVIEKIAVAELAEGEIIKRFQRDEKDVGSPEVQIALLTARIQKLTKHFESHTEDRHSKRGMLRIISQRKQLLAYLKRTNVQKYQKTIAMLGLRK